MLRNPAMMSNVQASLAAVWLSRAATLIRDEVDVCGRLVLGLQTHARVGDDPHRVFRELCWAAVEAISNLAYSVWFSLRDYWCATWDDWILRRSARTTFM